MVVGFGGYVSVPAYLAAWRRELPIVIHEVNVPPGVANRLGMKFTKHVAVGFPHQPSQAESLRDARVVGVPLRRRIAALDRDALRDAARAHFGLRPGPAGALRLRRLVRAPGRSTWRSPGRPRSWPATGVQVLHVIGARNEPVPIPTDLPVPYVTLPYLSEMELGYAAADLMLGRGGAMTCAEVAAIGLPDDLRAATRTATRSSGATRCRWWRPAAGCWSTTPS